MPPYLYAEEICQALGATGAVIPPATDYLAIMSLGTITMFLLLQVTGVMRAAGNSTLPMILVIGANVLNIVLDIWFVFGGLGLPSMGVAGAAWATVIARGVFAAWGIAALYRGFAGLRLRRWYWHWRTNWTILKIGIPSCAQWLVRMLSYLYMLRFLAEAAPKAAGAMVPVTQAVTEAQAAFGVGLRLDTVALFGGFGWGAAAATFVGQNLGRGLPERAVRATWIALGLNMVMMLLFAGAYVLFADPLLNVMGFDVGDVINAENVREIGRTYLYVASSGYVYLAVAVVISQALAGAGATKFPFFLEVVAYGVDRLPPGRLRGGPRGDVRPSRPVGGLRGPPPRRGHRVHAMVPLRALGPQGAEVTQGDPKVLKLERQLNLVSFLLSARAPGALLRHPREGRRLRRRRQRRRRREALRPGQGRPAVDRREHRVRQRRRLRARRVRDRPAGVLPARDHLEPEDAMLLAVLQRTMGVVDDSLGRNLKSALAKLTIDSRLPEPLRASMGEQHFLSMGKPVRDPARNHVVVLGEALGRRRRVEFRYAKPGETGATKRVVRPYGLGVADGDWHVAGFDEGREDVRDFRVDRIRGKVTLVDKKDGAYDVPADFDVGDVIGVEEYRIPQGNEVEVTVELDEVATWLMERRRQGVGTLERLDDGRGLFRVGVRSEDGLYRWVAEFGHHARIVVAHAHGGDVRPADRRRTRALRGRAAQLRLERREHARRRRARPARPAPRRRRGRGRTSRRTCAASSRTGVSS